jgi:hypothetical protein
MDQVNGSFRLGASSLELSAAGDRTDSLRGERKLQEAPSFGPGTYFGRFRHCELRINLHCGLRIN